MFQITDATLHDLSVDLNDHGGIDRSFDESEGSRASPPSHSALFNTHSTRTDLVATYPELDDVCEHLGFTHGVTLGAWTKNPSRALLTLAREARPPKARAAVDLTMATIPELVNHIVDTHHRVLRNEAARLRVLINHLAMEQFGGALIMMSRAFAGFVDSKLRHLQHEESRLFPLCIRLENASLGRCGWKCDEEVTSLIRHSSNGHCEFAAGISYIIGLANAAEANSHNPDLTTITSGLAAMAQELAVHTMVEGDLLIPAAIFAEEQIRARQKPRFV